MLSITPDPDKEFSLSCEMSLLFRMLYTARGNVCQASNLFRSTGSSVGPDKTHLSNLLLLSCSCALTAQDNICRKSCNSCMDHHYRLNLTPCSCSTACSLRLRTDTNKELVHGPGADLQRLQPGGSLPMLWLCLQQMYLSCSDKLQPPGACSLHACKHAKAHCPVMQTAHATGCCVFHNL